MHTWEMLIDGLPAVDEAAELGGWLIVAGTAGETSSLRAPLLVALLKVPRLRMLEALALRLQMASLLLWLLGMASLAVTLLLLLLLLIVRCRAAADAELGADWLGDCGCCSLGCLSACSME